MLDSFEKSLPQDKANGGDRRTDNELQGGVGGSSDNQQGAPFNSMHHITKLCEESGVEMRLIGNYIYPIGWREVIKDLIFDLRECGTTITEVTEHFGRLLVGFKTDDKQAEVKVWRALNLADIRATHTCEICGGKGILGVQRNYMVSVLCDSCKNKRSDKKTDRTKRTGTWLDHF